MSKKKSYMRLWINNLSIITLFLMSCALNAAQTPPQLTEYEACSKAEEILRSHARYREFSAIVAKRTLKNFVEELDPLKIYFTEEEVSIYLNPSDALIEQVVTDYRKQNLSTFDRIYLAMLAAIERRNTLEAKIDSQKLPKNVSSKLLKDRGFAKDTPELMKRLKMVRSLQRESAEALSFEQQDLLYQRIAKRRLNKEQELLGVSRLDQKRQTYAYFLKSVSEALDSHTVYFTPSEAKTFLIQVQQRLFGIGAQLRDDLNGFSVVHIVEDGPASIKNELKVGDRIVAVDHETVVGLDINEAVEMIRGPKGSTVVLTVIREHKTSHETLDIVIMRDEVVLTESRYQTEIIPYGDGAIAHIHLHAFYQDPNSSSTEDIKRAILQAKQKHKLLGIMLDLRTNSGGLLPEAVSVTGLFIRSGVVASIKDHTGYVQRLRSFNQEPVWDGPLIVLINRGSASAAEIVALTLSDYGRALVIGDDHSYGKGTYQTFTLESSNPNRINPQGEYKVTRGAYYTVGGGSPQLSGVKSDIEVPGILSKLDIGEAFTKYPLENDRIEPQFKDDLSDVHPLYRLRMRKMLGKTPQEKMVYLSPLIPSLKQNSAGRISLSSNYQNFLQYIDSVEIQDIDFEAVGQNDLQFEEACNIMKEMILQAPKKAS